MGKINDTLNVSVAALTDLVAQCGKVAGMAANIIGKNAVELPAEESSSEEDPKTTEEKPTFKEPTFEEGVLQGMALKRGPIDLINE